MVADHVEIPRTAGPLCEIEKSCRHCIRRFVWRYSILHEVHPASAVHQLRRLCRVLCPDQGTAMPNMRGLAFEAKCECSVKHV